MPKDNFMGLKKKKTQQDSIYKVCTDSSSQGVLEMDTDVLCETAQSFTK